MHTSELKSFQIPAYGSPLKKPGNGVLLCMLTAILIMLTWWAFPGRLHALFYSVIVASMALGIFASAIPFFVLRWFDRRDPEPVWVNLFAFLFGGLIASVLSVVFDDSAIAATATGSWVKPVVGNIAQALALFFIVFLFRGRFDGPRDGFVYGALIGLGYNWIEFVSGMTTIYNVTGVFDWLSGLKSHFFLLGLNEHVIYNGLFGTFLGFALVRNSRFRQMIFIFAGLLLAIVSQVFWIISGDDVTRWVSSNPDSWYAHSMAFFITDILAILFIFFGLRTATQWEKKLMKDELLEEVGTATIDAASYSEVIQHCELPKDSRIERFIFRLQIQLAKRKYYSRVRFDNPEADPSVQQMRADLHRVNGSANND